VSRIAEMFRADFELWGLEIPREALASRQPGFIQKAGWLIQYTFASNYRGEYLDYYASHRMTNDRHVRLYESGRRQSLAVLQELCPSSSDPSEAHRLKLAFFCRNRRVARKLIAKGFDKFTVNMELHCFPEAPDDSSGDDGGTAYSAARDRYRC